MANIDLTLAATFKAKPGKEDQLRQILERLVGPTLNEEGNLGYALHQGVQDPTLFYFYEAYKDQAAIDHHMNTPYLAKALEESKDLLDSPLQATVLRQIAGTRPTN